MRKLIAGVVASVIALSAVFSTTPYLGSFNKDNASVSLYVPLKADVLALARKAYLKRLKEDPSTKPYVMIVDFSYPSDKYRMFVYDMKNNHILYQGLVAHGSGSGIGRYATSFSNQDGTHKSSIGLYRVTSTYSGKHGRSAHLVGLEPGYNSNAFSRSIVLHSALYVTDSFAIAAGRVGNSWGCFAMPRSASTNIINLVGEGSLLVAYHSSLERV